MKEVLALIYAALIQPLIDALKENNATLVAALQGKAAPAADTPSEASEAPAKLKGKGGKAEKPAAESKEKVTKDDILAHLKSFKDEAVKEKLAGWMTKTFKAEKLSDLEEEHYPALLAKLIEKGATDTRKKEEAPAGDDW